MIDLCDLRDYEEEPHRVEHTRYERMCIYHHEVHAARLITVSTDGIAVVSWSVL